MQRETVKETFGATGSDGQQYTVIHIGINKLLRDLSSSDWVELNTKWVAQSRSGKRFHINALDDGSFEVPTVPGLTLKRK